MVINLHSSTITYMAFLTSLEVIISLLLILCIVLQQRTSGLRSALGGAGVPYVQRRGAEKLLYQATVWLSASFFAIAVLQWYI